MTTSKPPPPASLPRAAVRHIDCPNCEFLKAVIAATRYGELMCFCPQCEYAWDCPDLPPTACPFCQHPGTTVITDNIGARGALTEHRCDKCSKTWSEEESAENAPT